MKTKEQLELKAQRNIDRRNARNARKAGLHRIKKENKDNEVEDWKSPRLIELRKKKRERKIVLKAKHKVADITPTYMKRKKQETKTLVELGKELSKLKKLALKQSIEDKAKHKASLVTFKETYVRTYKVQDNNILDIHRKNCRCKKVRGFARKQRQAAKTNSQEIVQQAA